MRGTFLASFHESVLHDRTYGERPTIKGSSDTSDYQTPPYPLDHSPVPTRHYPFLDEHELTSMLDTSTLIKHDMVDEERRPIKLELDDELLELIVGNINYVFEQEKLSPKVDLEKLVAGKVEAIARQLRPELVKEEAGVRVAAELLDYQFEEAQIRRALMAGVEISVIGSLERNAIRPGDTLRHDFAVWSEEEREYARQEAIDLMAERIDPRFSTDFQVFAGREVEVEEPETVVYQEEDRLRDFGKGVLRRLISIGA